jgi:hypothetical protein
LKQQAIREGSSLNSLVVRLLQGQPGTAPGSFTPHRFDDLDMLAGPWTARQADAFERATAPFAEVDPSLWK